MKSMKVEIWSDIVCPFCYIGKRNFEQALHQFDNPDNVEILWRSFELAPDAKTEPKRSIYEALAERKGWTLEQSKEIHSQMQDRAKQSGLEYHFDKTIPANSLNAHKLLHLAKEHNVQDQTKENLLKAYFTEGKNIDDASELIKIGNSVGLSEEKVLEALNSDAIKQEVEQDILAARQVGVQGVPFFVFNQKYAVSGAQPSDLFLDVLEKVQREMEEENRIQSIPGKESDGEFCSTDGNC
jgi:predicted DsbA family dithiol-disulfide isomerase